MSDAVETVLYRGRREIGNDAEEAVYAFLQSLEDVAYVQRAHELWEAQSGNAAGVPYCYLDNLGGEAALCPDFLVTLKTGVQKWVEVKSTFNLNEWKWNQYTKLAKAQPYRAFRMYFAIHQGAGLWHLYRVALGKMTYSDYDYISESPYYKIKPGGCIGPVAWQMEAVA